MQLTPRINYTFGHVKEDHLFLVIYQKARTIKTEELQLKWAFGLRRERERSSAVEGKWVCAREEKVVGKLVPPTAVRPMDARIAFIVDSPVLELLGDGMFGDRWLRGMTADIVVRRSRGPAGPQQMTNTQIP